MTVEELIARLLQLGCPGATPVVLSQDPEGNGFAELQDVEASAWNGEDTGLLELTPYLVEQGYSEEDVLDAPPAVVLWP